jgi:hypothetical protein
VAIDTTIITASLQTKLNETTNDTESNDFLLLTKAIEAIAGYVAAGDVKDEGDTQIALVAAASAIQITAVVAEGTIQKDELLAITTDVSITSLAETRSASIDMADNLLLRPEIRDYTETVQAMAADDVDCSAASVHTKTVSADVTFTFSNPPTAGKSSGFTIILELSNSAIVTWPTSVKWSYGGAAPVLTATGTDIFTFMTIDGGAIWYGFPAGQEMV